MAPLCPALRRAPQIWFPEDFLACVALAGEGRLAWEDAALCVKLVSEPNPSQKWCLKKKSVVEKALAAAHLSQAAWEGNRRWLENSIVRRWVAVAVRYDTKQDSHWLVVLNLWFTGERFL